MNANSPISRNRGPSLKNVLQEVGEIDEFDLRDSLLTKYDDTQLVFATKSPTIVNRGDSNTELGQFRNQIKLGTKTIHVKKESITFDERNAFKKGNYLLPPTIGHGEQSIDMSVMSIKSPKAKGYATR